jgi:hypothetical protein
LHAHLLIEVRWIDASLLARRWAEEIGTEDFCIVKVKDARATDYAEEVAKYVCKPASLAAWTGEDIAAVMDAFKRRRSFGACNWQIEDPELDGIPK